jgi:maltose alpha-D-glucosyltransferase / alpha-amylase
MSRRCLYITVIAFCFAACRQQQPNVTDNSDPAWYKQQIIYNLDIKVFKDSDGNGIGDFKGLISRLGYLDSLGVTTLWLAPFQPSPLQDDGYDVTDYTGIDPRVGTPADFRQFMQAAKQHRIKVIMDVVLNHSSIQHPWFRARPDWYVWSVKRPADWDEGMGFPKVEKESWRLDSATGKYFFHRFYHFQPDLNFQNKQLLAEAERILLYWLKQGVDGFRLDAVPFIIDDPRPSAADPRHHFGILHDLARAVRKVKPDAVLLGEANVEPEETKDYFSKQGEGLDMMLNFEVNEYLFYALAGSNARPLQNALQVTAEKPPKAQWVYFLRNHDEVDLGKLSKKEIKEVYEKMGPDTMQLYDRGIRRRLAPMLNNNLRLIKQAYALVLALPGTVALRYGEEIGMGDDLSLKERFAVRTPMQWDSSRNAGFSTGAQLIRPVISTGEYGYRKVNTLQQQNNPKSLLHFTRRLLRLRKARPEIAQGRWDVPDAGNEHCLLIRYYTNSGPLLAVFNFSDKQQKISLPDNASAIKDLISGRSLSTINGNELTLPANAGYWLALHK